MTEGEKIRRAFRAGMIYAWIDFNGVGIASDWDKAGEYADKYLEEFLKESEIEDANSTPTDE